MKRITMSSAVAGFLLLAGTIGCYAQQYSYKLTRGKVTSTVQWTEQDNGNGKTITIEPFPGKSYVQKVDARHRTTEWHFTCKSEETDVKITLRDGTYSISGLHKGKKVEKSVKSNGKPWYQNISYASEHLLKKEGEVLTYECFRPDNLDFNTMTATHTGKEELNGINTDKIRINPTGKFAKMWSCHYFIDPARELMICYKAVEGMPGTPLTTWMLTK